MSKSLLSLSDTTTNSNDFTIENPRHIQLQTIVIKRDILRSLNNLKDHNMISQKEYDTQYAKYRLKGIKL